MTLPVDLAVRLHPIDAPVPDAGSLRHAAVLAILLRDVTEDAAAPRLATTRIVLIERAGDLRSHAGQLAFPGGKPEPSDRDLLETARREAAEEVALPHDGTVVLGRLDHVPTPTGFMIVPFVAWAPSGWLPAPVSPEVQRILTPSLEQLADPSIHHFRGSGIWGGTRYELHEFAIHEPPLWGATARMVWDLLERIRG